MKKIINIVIIVALLLIGFKIVTDFLHWNKAWKIEVTTASINVRKNPSPYDSKLGEIVRGKKYEVLDINLDDSSFVWYKIKYKKGIEGWVASNRNNPYVLEINNPNYEGEEQNKQIKYKAPIIKFYDEVYHTLSLRTINYKHLEIVGDWEYEVSHVVYFEEFPVDKSEPNYWIEYIIEDEFGNKDSKVQRIVFEDQPNRNEVKDFKELKAKRGQ